MRKALATGLVALSLTGLSIAPAHAGNWFDTISPSNWVCKVWPVFC